MGIANAEIKCECVANEGEEGGFWDLRFDDLRFDEWDMNIIHQNCITVLKTYC